MNAFGIFWQVIFPIFFIILIGALLERALTLDISTLTRINFYAFVPALVFVKMLQADLSLLTMGHIALFVLAHSALMLLIALLLYQHRMFQPYRKVLLLASMLTNAGNYGIPFVLLAFGDRYMSVAAVVLLVQNLLTFTVGVLLMESSQQQRMHILRAISRLVSLPVALRLAIAPLLALAMLPLFTFPHDVGTVLVATAGLPIAVNVFILSAQYHVHEAFASQIATVSTLLSAVSQSAWLAFLQ